MAALGSLSLLIALALAVYNLLAGAVAIRRERLPKAAI